MGTWGHGNLDSDYARDELAGRSKTLVDALMERAARPDSREGDEYDYTTLFVELEIAIALDGAKLLVGSTLPAADAVRALATDYLAGWDANIDALEPTPEHKRERRRIIAATFERFAKLCATHATARAGRIARLKKPATPAKKPAKKRR